MPLSDFEMEHGYKDYGVNSSTLHLLFSNVINYLDTPYIVARGLQEPIVGLKERNDRLDVKHEEGYYTFISGSVKSIEVLYHTEPYKLEVETISEAIRLVGSDVDNRYMGIKISFKDTEDAVIVCSVRDLE